MAVITISRELGSGGSYIGRQVAQTLGYHFVDKDTIEAVLVQYGFVEFSEEYDSLPGFWARFDARRAELVDMLNRVIKALAQHGDVVILGRGSFAVLGGLADVLHVRVKAPLPIRVRQVMVQQQIADADQAEVIVTESDRIRADFIDFSYRVQWDTAAPFDLVIDTAKVSPELAVTWLVQTIRTWPEQPEADRPTARALQVDSILADAVANVLDCQVRH